MLIVNDDLRKKRENDERCYFQDVSEFGGCPSSITPVRLTHRIDVASRKNLRGETSSQTFLFASDVSGRLDVALEREPQRGSQKGVVQRGGLRVRLTLSLCQPDKHVIIDSTNAASCYSRITADRYERK